MSRGQNFFYQDSPATDIAHSIATAWFGDPALAAKQRDIQAQAALREAQMREAEAHGGLYTEQARGVRGQNNAADQLPALSAAMFTPPPAPRQPSLSDPDFVSAAGPSTPYHAPTQQDVLRQNLPAFVAALSQMQGDKVSPSETMGTLAAFMGDDELARRGLVAQRATPGENFALTPQRADAISARDAAEAQTSAFGVARINHANDIPVANIQAGAARYGDDRRLEGTKYTVDNRDGGATRGQRNNNPGNLEYGAFARSLGATGSDGRFAVFPTYDAGVAAQEALLKGGSYYGAGLRTIDAILSRYAPPGENPTTAYGDYVARVTGIPRNRPLRPEEVSTVAAAMRQFESGGGTGAVLKTEKEQATADKWRLGGGGAKPTMVSKATTDKLTDMIGKFEDAHKVTLSAATRESVLSQAVTAYQQSGNLVDAIARATARLSVNGQDARDRDAKGNGPPARGARQAPDGNWYVQTGRNQDGSPAYSKVEGSGPSAVQSGPGVWDRAMSYLPGGSTREAPRKASAPARGWGKARIVNDDPAGPTVSNW